MTPNPAPAAHGFARAFSMLRRNVMLFFEGAVLSYIALFAWLRPSQYLATKVVAPLGQILFFTFMGTFGKGGRGADFYIIGNAVQLVALSGIYGVTFSITGERWSGTLPYLFGGPANRLLTFAGRSVMHIIDGMVGVVIGLLWGVLLLGLSLGNTDLLGLAAVILITSISTSGMGLLLGSFSLVSRNVMFVNNSAYFGLLIFSGSNIAIEKLPSLFRQISSLLPLTRGITAARAVIGGASLTQVADLLQGEILVGLIYGGVGYALFRAFELVAKRRGTLEVF